MEALRLETGRLVLRTLEPADAGALRDFHLRNRAFFEPWEPERDEAYFERSSFERMIGRDLEELAAGREVKLCLFERGAAPGGDAAGTGTIAGSAGLTGIARGPFLSCFLGYRIDSALAGRGLMSEALRALVAFAFGPLGLHRIEANIMPRNAASIRVVRALGFEREGSSPRYLRINGAWEDHDHYVLRNAALE